MVYVLSTSPGVGTAPGGPCPPLTGITLPSLVTRITIITPPLLSSPRSILQPNFLLLPLHLFFGNFFLLIFNGVFAIDEVVQFSGEKLPGDFPVLLEGPALVHLHPQAGGGVSEEHR